MPRSPRPFRLCYDRSYVAAIIGIRRVNGRSWVVGSPHTTRLGTFVSRWAGLRVGHSQPPCDSSLFAWKRAASICDKLSCVPWRLIEEDRAADRTVDGEVAGGHRSGQLSRLAITDTAPPSVLPPHRVLRCPVAQSSREIEQSAPVRRRRSALPSTAIKLHSTDADSSIGSRHSASFGQ